MRAFRYQSLPSRVVFGNGSSRHDLVSEVGSLGGRVLLITTKRAEPLADELVVPLGDRVVGRFTDVRDHVPQESADAARTAADRLRADCLLSIGGGSVVGTAKAVAVQARVPIVAVPTTYAGSEMTPTWGVTAAGRKRTARSPDALPRSVVYDPALTVSLPAGVTAASGMNAMSHCVGALYLPSTDPITGLIAEEGVRALAAGLPRAVSAPDDLAARADALYGAYLAGATLAVVGPPTHHRICHVLGGAYGLPHAQTHAVVLPYAALLLDVDLSRVAAVLGVSRAADGLRAIAERTGAPTSLAEIGMLAADLDEAAGLIAAQGILDAGAAREFLAAAHEGRWEQ
jgi:alcohol dehydrogenase class IV